jgi:hypothetical protein
METYARIEGLKPFLIHGEPWVQVFYSRTGAPDEILQARMSADTLPEALTVGETVIIGSVLGIVTEIRRAEVERD